jgi:Ca-activated chloride channel family protein
LLKTIKTPILLACVVPFVCAPQTVPEFRSKAEIVAVPCAVVDANGSVVPGVTRDQFRVYDNGVRRIIRDFWFDKDLPLTLGIVVDASESQSDQIAEHEKTVLELLEKVLRPGDRAFVVSVDEDVKLWADLTATADGVREQISRSRGRSFGEPCPKSRAAEGLKPASVCGSSPLWNAIYDTARLKLGPLEGSKALLILTDGVDSGSTHTWHEAAAAVQRAEASFYAIQYPSDYGKGNSRDFYQLLAETGGIRFAIPNGEYGRIVSRLSADLRQQYVLGLRPGIAAGKIRHELNVEVTRPELVVRARRIYFEDGR